MNTTMNTALALILLMIAQQPALANALSELESEYLSLGATSFSATNGKALWYKKFESTEDNKSRSCSSCHAAEPGLPGRHIKTGKPIEAMAPSVNPDRLSSAKKVRKWFIRNCQWTLGRECTAQEKGDLLAFLKSL